MFSKFHKSFSLATLTTHTAITSFSRKKINLFDMNRIQLHNFFLSLGEKSFRADQVMQWIYHYYCDNFDQMTNLDKKLRAKLKILAEIRAPKVVAQQTSRDGTIKWAVKIDNQKIEMVYIPDTNRATLCISSQIGCALQCTFCSTAKQGFNRNLRVSEIIGQVWRAAKIIHDNNISNQHPITNIVMMGMGEPLLNLTNVVPAIEIMLDDFGFRLSKRHITLSTSGIVPALEKLSNMIDVVLAISLHAPNDFIRNKLMPINQKYNIKKFLSAVRYYLDNTKANKGRVTVEYVMLNHINDEIEHAHQLAVSLKDIPCKINLIPWNSFDGAPYNCSSASRIDRFAKILISYGIISIVRKIRGDDINAACGQLVGEVIDRTRYKSYHKK